ncbi:arf-GAP domain and FG repeat-containing protein 2 [Manacus candei]|uniref:arf-GAP domain and FG repeat-containing protein 2 n=1 Tax=Manacus candei TaxID=415023 RepID=UPI00222794B5|nr:arf-GAP domain and FG repeat-containing protein 2 [Manacus candei]
MLNLGETAPKLGVFKARWCRIRSRGGGSAEGTKKGGKSRAHGASRQGALLAGRGQSAAALRRGRGPAGAGRWRRAEAAAPAPERGPAEAPGVAGAARAGTRRPRFGAGGCGSWRGLNPPHRVKSISMTTFSEAEVLFLQERGNEACRRVWLGTFDPRISELPDSRDPQKVKEFLQEKYEKKRWYVAPEQVKPPQSTTEAPQLLLGDTGTLPQSCPAAQRPPQPPRKSSTDLLADIGGDPFATPTLGPTFAAFPGPAPPHSAFPHFDAFGATLGAPTFGGAGPPFHTPPTATGIAAARGGATSAPPTGGGASPSLFGTLGPPPAPPYGGYTNPFVTPRPSTNPFQSNGPGAAFTTPPVPGGFPSPFQADASPFGGFNVAKASTNPFVTAPTAPLGIRHPTTNPFL